MPTSISIRWKHHKMCVPRHVFAIFLFYFLWLDQVQACSNLEGYHLYTVSFPASITVDRNASNGVIATASTTGTPWRLRNCQGRTMYRSMMAGSAVSGSSSTYSTNVVGIGYQITTGQNTWPGSQIIQRPDTGSGNVTFTIHLVKTGAATAGTVTAGSYGLNSLSGVGNIYHLGMNAVQINVRQPTCTISTGDQSVSLGNMSAGGFANDKGGPWKDFSVSFSSCSNVGTITFATSAGEADANKTNFYGISSVSGAAQGVAIELSRNEASHTNAIDPGASFGIGTGGAANATARFRARYRQTLNTLKPGSANGAITFTISYS